MYTKSKGQCNAYVANGDRIESIINSQDHEFYLCNNLARVLRDTIINDTDAENCKK